MSSPKYLFVYGTLRRNETPPEVTGLMGSLELVGAGSVPGHIFDLGEYPGAIFDPTSTSRVRGEIYKLPKSPQFLRKLDSYEEFDPNSPRQSLFIRVNTAVETNNGERLNCWAYRINSNRLKKRSSRKASVKPIRRSSARASR